MLEKISKISGRWRVEEGVEGGRWHRQVPQWDHRYGILFFFLFLNNSYKIFNWGFSLIKKETPIPGPLHGHPREWRAVRLESRSRKALRVLARQEAGRRFRQPPVGHFFFFFFRNI